MQTTPNTRFKIAASGLSDIGLVRQNNEDIWAQLAEDNFFILADGMGGHQAGEIAARETVTNMCRLVRKKITPVMESSTIDEIKILLRKAIRHVNAAVFQMSRDQEELRGMGTTLCCLLFHDKGLIYAHVGDSRIYRYRNYELTQLTKDHSLLSQLVEQGKLKESDARGFLHKNIITKAIGTEPKIEPSIDQTDFETGDCYLMCSDGLSDLLSKDEIEEIIANSPSTQEAVVRLVAEANGKGGLDNITVLIAQVQSAENLKDSYDSPNPHQLADIPG